MAIVTTGANSAGRQTRSLSGRVVAFIGVYVVLVVVAVPYVVPPLPKTVSAWIEMLLVVPGLYLLGEWLGEKFGGAWGEHRRLYKFLKALVFVVVVLVLLLVRVVFAVAISGLIAVACAG